jgi:hypothetical protein
MRMQQDIRCGLKLTSDTRPPVRSFNQLINQSILCPNYNTTGRPLSQSASRLIDRHCIEKATQQTLPPGSKRKIYRALRGRHTSYPLPLPLNIPKPSSKNAKRTAALMSLILIGIAEGGARTHDLEVDLFAVIRATRSTD